jgi:thermitase
VAAAGNSNNSIPIYPAGYQNVVATAALQNTGVKSSVSNYGAYVDVGAPNTTVWTTSGASYTAVSGATSYCQSDRHGTGRTDQVLPACHLAG